MNNMFDDISLSSYMDGELDPESSRKITAMLETNAEAREYIINAVRTTALLRQTMNKAMYEEVPEKLINAVSQEQKKTGGLKRFIPNQFRVAAGIVLVLIGFGTGLWLDYDGQKDNVSLSLPLSAPYRQVIADSLEYDVSGVSRKWQSSKYRMTITVTPVQTYRGRDNRYFRKFIVEETTENGLRRITGIAYRQKGDWITKALYYP